MSFLTDQRRWAVEQRRLQVMKYRIARHWMIEHPERQPGYLDPSSALQHLRVNFPELFDEPQRNKETLN